MQNFKPGTDVPLTFSLMDEAGNVLTPAALNWRILDEADIELQTWAPILPLPTLTDVSITIPALLTTLTAPALRALRTVELEVVTAQGTILLSDTVMLQGSTALAFGVNSFQTYSQALLESENFVGVQLPGWVASSREDREKALIEAHQRILMLPLRTQADSSQSSLQPDTIFPRDFGSGMLRNMTPAQVGLLFMPLLIALRKAQLIEADDILNTDPVIQARKNGLTSLTVGESSQFFRGTRPLDLPVCERAIKYLQRWVRFGARIGRS